MEEPRNLPKIVNPARGKDIFALLPSGFGKKSLIFQLFPRLAKAAIKSEMRTKPNNRKAVNRLSHKQLHLNHAEPDRTKDE